MNLAPTSAGRDAPAVGARATHVVGGCAAVALLVSALLPWPAPDASMPDTRVAQHVAVERPATFTNAETTPSDEPSRPDLDTVGASIAAFDR